MRRPSAQGDGDSDLGAAPRSEPASSDRVCPKRSRQSQADLTEAKAQDQVAVQDVELAADIIIGVSLQVTRGTFQRRPPVDLSRQALDAVLRAIGAVRVRHPALRAVPRMN
jgi:hypothetical protein